MIAAATTSVGQHAFWLASRASGIVALILLSLSVVVGLALSGKLSEDPGSRLKLTVIHEVSAIAVLVAIAAHGLFLLGDGFLKPGLSGITVPFAIGYRPFWTGLGIIGGYLALILGPSFYLRRLVGVKRWRSMHRYILIAWLLAAVHTIGAGTDASTLWMRTVVFSSAAIVATLTIARLLPAGRAKRRERPAEHVTPRQVTVERRLPDRAFAQQPG